MPCSSMLKHRFRMNFRAAIRNHDGVEVNGPQLRPFPNNPIRLPATEITGGAA